jgi:nucleoside-diphosphate-sugar epimerase
LLADHEFPRSGLDRSGVYVDDVVAASIKAAVRDGAGSGPWIVSGAQPFDWVALIGARSVASSSTASRRTGDAESAPSRRSARDRAMAPGARRANMSAWRQRLDRLRERVVALSARRGPAVYRPAADDPSLYLSKGACDITRARRELGFAPAFDLDSGLRRTSDYIRWRYRK